MRSAVIPSQVINCHGGMSLVLEAFPSEHVWRVRTYNSMQGDHYVPGSRIFENRWTHLAVVRESLYVARLVCKTSAELPQ